MDQRLVLLSEIARRISADLDLQATLDAVVAAAAELIPCALAEVSLWDADAQTLTLLAIRCEPERTYPVGKSFPLGEGYTAWMVHHRRSLLVPDVDSWQEIRPDLLPGERPFKAYLGVPLLPGETLIGTLVLIADQAGAFDPEDQGVLEALGHHAATAIHNARLHEEALAAERMAAIGRVATSVAHDLRSPLGGIVRSAEFLARPELSAETRRKLSQSVVSLARRLLNTTQEILDYVRGGELPLHRAPCSLPAFLDQVLPVMEVDFADRGIEVVCNCTYQGTVVMDADRIAQVIYNIAANARDVMPHGGTFTVTARRVGARVELSFADTGPGVPQELEERIFEPFFTLGKREGAGLGLAIARRIVEEHGGELRLERGSEPGAVFVVSLPA